MSKFTPSIWINDGGHLTVRAIDTVEEALAYLNAWRGKRAAEFDHTVTTIEAALEGGTTAKSCTGCVSALRK